MNRLLRVLLVLACFELGILLMIAPWLNGWEQNYFLDRFPSLIPIVLHPAVRGLISGLGVLDVILAASFIRRRRLILCYVTDRVSLRRDSDSSDGAKEVLDCVARAVAAGVDWIQIREKDLATQPLTNLVSAAVAGVRRRGSPVRVLVNDRLDVALSAGAAGVHLAESSPVPEVIRRQVKGRTPNGFLVGVSCHSLEAARDAERSGADYVIFGPVFSTPSKLEFGPPQGIERLAEVCRAIRIPVLAIGGISVDNAKSCVDSGAAGLAAIRLFQEPQDQKTLATIVHSLRR